MLDVKGSARLDPSRLTRQTLRSGIVRAAAAKALVPDPVKAIQEEVDSAREYPQDIKIPDEGVLKVVRKSSNLFSKEY